MAQAPYDPTHLVPQLDHYVVEPERPIRPGGRRRPERLFITVTPSEKRLIQSAAEWDGLTASEWARGRLLTAAKRTHAQVKQEVPE